MWIDLPVGVSVGSRTPHLIFCIPGLVDALVLTGSGRCPCACERSEREPSMVFSSMLM